MSPHPKKGWKFYLAYSIFLIVVLILGAEASLRILGYRPWQPDALPFHVDPGPGLFQSDSLLGFKGKPGKFTCSLGDSIHFQVNHDSSGFREHPFISQQGLQNLPEIWIFGCSFTHGYGVNDDETWPVLIQQGLKGYRIRNFAMTAYSTYQCRLLLEYLLQRQVQKPSHVIYAYGAFHQQRNTASRFWKKAISGHTAASGIQFPYLKKEGDSWVRRTGKPDYEPWTGQNWSALIHYLENQSNHRDELERQSAKITAELIQEMARMTEDAGAKWVIATVQNDPATRESAVTFASMTVLDISADLENPQYRLHPQDGHPNKQGHSWMAKRFLQQFKP